MCYLIMRKEFKYGAKIAFSKIFHHLPSSAYIESLKMGDSKQMHQFWQCDLFLQMASSRCEHFKVVCCSLSIPAQTIQPDS